MMWILKIEKKLRSKENNARNVIKDIKKKSILELENMEKINKIKIIINNKIKELNAARM